MFLLEAVVYEYGANISDFWQAQLWKLFSETGDGKVFLEVESKGCGNAMLITFLRFFTQ